MNNNRNLKRKISVDNDINLTLTKKPLSKGKSLLYLQTRKGIKIEMNNLLLKNGLTSNDFDQLPALDKTEWLRLQTIYDDLTTIIETDNN